MKTAQQKEKRVNVIFKQFRREGVTLLAIPQPDNRGVSIIDSEGFAYGAYFSVESFDKFIKRQGGLKNNRIGCARVNMSHVSPLTAGGAR